MEDIDKERLVIFLKELFTEKEVIAVDISKQGEYPPLFTDTELNNCFSIHQTCDYPCKRPFSFAALSSQSEGARKHYSLVWCTLLLSRYLSQVPVVTETEMYQDCHTAPK